MRISKSALHVSYVRFPDRSIRGQLQAASLNERSGSHNNGVLVPRHIPRLRNDVRIDGCRRLDRLHEMYERIRRSETDCLDKVGTRIVPFRVRLEAEIAEYGGGEYASLDRLTNEKRSKKQPLVYGARRAEHRAYFSADPRCGKPERRKFH